MKCLFINVDKYSVGHIDIVCVEGENELDVARKVLIKDYKFSDIHVEEELSRWEMVGKKWCRDGNENGYVVVKVSEISTL